MKNEITPAQQAKLLTIEDVIAIALPFAEKWSETEKERFRMELEKSQLAKDLDEKRIDLEKHRQNAIKEMQTMRDQLESERQKRLDTMTFTLLMIGCAALVAVGAWGMASSSKEFISMSLTGLTSFLAGIGVGTARAKEAKPPQQ